jgi:hypothetical protein
MRLQSKGGDRMTLEILKSKAAFSNVVTEDQVIERYKGLAIVKSEKGFNSKEEIDQYVEQSLASKI